MRLYPTSGYFLIFVPFQLLIIKRFTTLLQTSTISVSYQFFSQEQIKCKRKKNATKEKKNGRKKERKLAQGDSSSAKETG